MTSENYSRLRETIFEFWVDCGLNTEFDRFCVDEDILEQGNQIGILYTSVYDDEVLGMQTYKQIYPDFDSNVSEPKGRWLEVVVDTDTLSILKTLDGIPDWIFFDDEESLIEYMRGISERDLIYEWSDEFIDDFKRRIALDNRNKIHAG